MNAMRRILRALLPVLAMCIATALSAQSFPPSKFPAPVKVMTDAGVAQYWNVKRIMCLGKSGGGYKFRIFGQAEATTGSQTIEMFYILPGNKLQTAGAYRFPAITKGEAFQFDIVSAYTGYAPRSFLGFMIMDENLKVAETPAPPAVEEINLVEEDVALPEKAAPEPEDNEIYDKVETEPVFPGGLAGIFRHIGAHMKYPPLAAENGVQGRVVVGLVVEKNGTVSNVKVLKGVSAELDKEAVRVVNTLPAFSSPGKINGRPKRTRISIPITFKLSC